MNTVGNGEKEIITIEQYRALEPVRKRKLHKAIVRAEKKLTTWCPYCMIKDCGNPEHLNIINNINRSNLK